MKKIIPIIAVASLTVACGSNSETEDLTNNMPTPPIAEKQEELIITHGDTIADNYFWMRLSDEEKEAENPSEKTQKVLDYLNAENSYLDEVMKPTEQLQGALYDEIVGRIKQDDESVPVTKNGYSYYSRFEEGEDYGLH